MKVFRRLIKLRKPKEITKHMLLDERIDQRLKTKKIFEELVIENLKQKHGELDPAKIIKRLSMELILEAERMLKASWNPPPYDPFLLVPLRNALLIENNDLKDKFAFLEPITEENFNIYYNRKDGTSNHHLRYSIAKEIAYTFFSPAKRLFSERKRDNELSSFPKLEQLSETGAFEMLMPEEHFKREVQNMGFSPLSCESLSEIFDVTRMMILKRMAELAPCPCSIVILQFDTPQVKDKINFQTEDVSIPSIEKLVKTKASKTDRYRVILSINSPDFPYTIPLNKSMSPDTIFYHAAMFNKPLSGPYQINLNNRKVKTEVDVMLLAKPSPKESYPPLLVFFKIIK
jgi:Zn-dependent peptidase ImmA (M78 family)